jgi:organic radical activating enzyme
MTGPPRQPPPIQSEPELKRGKAATACLAAWIDEFSNGIAFEGAEDEDAVMPQGESEASPSATPAKYRSCRFIERGLVIKTSRAITPCCVNPATGESPLLARFDGTDVSVDAALEARAGLIARHKAGTIEPGCRDCPKLQEHDWAGAMSPYPIDEITMAPFSSCNIRCNYCYTVVDGPWISPLSKAPRILPTIQALIERKLLDPNGTVRFSGGEPTLSPEFDPLLELLTTYGVRCIVYTNATKRSDAIVQALRRDKVELVLGIDAVSVEVYKAIKKMNYCEKVWKVVADYCAAIQPGAVNKVWTKFIFCVENYHEAVQFVHRAEAAGAKHVYYALDTSRGSGRLRQDLGELPEIITDYIAIFRHECAKRSIIAEFAQFGPPWLTPERIVRIESELDRLKRADEATARFTPPVPGGDATLQPR